MNPFITTLWVGLGGAIGTIARYWIATLALPISRSLPWGTILINIGGSFIIGFVGTFTLANGRHPLPETARLFVMVGICGGFTTFSSFSLQTLDLIRMEAWPRALLNIGFSVILCLLAVALGHALGAQLNGGARPVVQNIAEEETS
jgi:CrcB protein